MASTFALAQPRYPTTTICIRSASTTSRSNDSIKVPARWRSSTYVRKRQTRESSPRFKLDSPGVQEYFHKNEEKSFPDLLKTQPSKKLYVDQQTGEMRASTTDRTVIDEINEDGVTTQIRRLFTNRRTRSRTQSDTSSPRLSRCVWDRSLKTSSIPINSRAASSFAENPCRLSVVPNPYLLPRSKNLLPRISKSAENITTPSSPFEITTRYPRGQQRPTGLASGHHALLLRHREIVEASKMTRDRWKQRKKQDEFRNDRIDFPVRYLGRNYPSYLRVPEHCLPVCDITSAQKRCGQEVKSFMKANQKCLEWFNTWVDD